MAIDKIRAKILLGAALISETPGRISSRTHFKPLSSWSFQNAFFFIVAALFTTILGQTKYTSTGTGVVAKKRATAKTERPTSYVAGRYFNRFVTIWCENTDYDMAAGDCMSRTLSECSLLTFQPTLRGSTIKELPWRTISPSLKYTLICSWLFPAKLKSLRCLGDILNQCWLPDDLALSAQLCGSCWRINSRNK